MVKETRLILGNILLRSTMEMARVLMAPGMLMKTRGTIRVLRCLQVYGLFKFRTTPVVLLGTPLTLKIRHVILIT